MIKARLLDIQDGVEQGNVNPLEAYVELKAIENTLKEVMAKVQPLAITEADKYNEKSFKAFGAVIEKRSAPATYDMSHINAYLTAKEKVKYIETIAKAGGGIDPETGQEIEKAIRVEGKSTIAVKI